MMATGLRPLAAPTARTALGLSIAIGDGLVAGGVAVADAEQLLPDLALKRGAVQGQGQIEAA